MAHPGKMRAVTFAASTRYGVEYGVGFYAEDDGDEGGGASGDRYGDLISFVDDTGRGPTEHIEQAQAVTLAFAKEICRRWNAEEK